MMVFFKWRMQAACLHVPSTVLWAQMELESLSLVGYF